MIQLKNVRIKGFRKFIDESISLEKELTVVAGGNNSGKTSLIDLLASILKDSRKKPYFDANDFNADAIYQWSLDVYNLFNDSSSDEDINTNEEKNTENQILPNCPEIYVELTVEYDPKSDDISLFAPYIMDLETSENSIYLLFEYSVPQKSQGKMKDEIWDILRKITSLNFEAKNEVTATAEAKATLRNNHALKEILNVFVNYCESSYAYCESNFST